MRLEDLKSTKQIIIYLYYVREIILKNKISDHIIGGIQRFTFEI